VDDAYLAGLMELFATGAVDNDRLHWAEFKMLLASFGHSGGDGDDAGRNMDAEGEGAPRAGGARELAAAVAEEARVIEEEAEGYAAFARHDVGGKGHLVEAEVGTGLGRTLALHHRSSSLHQIFEELRSLYV
jgi:hypothetical protein